VLFYAGGALTISPHLLHLSAFDLIEPQMSLRERTGPRLGIIEPCLPSPAKAPPCGPGWIHEIKHDGFRMLARRDGAGVRLITRHGKRLHGAVSACRRSGGKTARALVPA
jgi:ATP-dependent DNA ligase